MSLTDLSQVTTETILQLVGSTQTVGSETPFVDELDASGNIYRCHGTVVPTANTPGYAKPSFFNKTNAGAGINGLYVNVGTNLLCNFIVVDTAVGGGASFLVDTNGNTALDVGTTAAAVNNLRVTNSATGAVGANAVTLTAVGTDAAVSLSIAPKGVTAITTIGLATGTGDIIVGSSSGAQAVELADGTGAATVELANTTTAGATVTMAGQATATGITDTINIATGNTVGTGSKVVHIADGTPAGTNVVTIGSLANTANTTAIQGGNGATAITLTPQITGTITMGAPAGTGDVLVGKSSTGQSVKIGDGAGIATVNIANTTVAGAVVNVASAVTGAGITDTTTIAGGNAAATGIKVVNVLTGTPGTSGNNRLTMGGGSTSAITRNAVVTSYFAENRTTGSAVANAPVATLVNASGANVTVAAGLRILLTLAAGLQAGANTLNLNGHGADSIVSHFNTANNIGTAYAATGFVDLLFDGTRWLDMSQ